MFITTWAIGDRMIGTDEDSLLFHSSTPWSKEEIEQIQSHKLVGRVNKDNPKTIRIVAKHFLSDKEKESVCEWVKQLVTKGVPALQ